MVTGPIAVTGPVSCRPCCPVETAVTLTAGRPSDPLALPRLVKVPWVRASPLAVTRTVPALP